MNIHDSEIPSEIQNTTQTDNSNIVGEENTLGAVEEKGLYSFDTSKTPAKSSQSPVSQKFFSFYKYFLAILAFFELGNLFQNCRGALNEDDQNKPQLFRLASLILSVWDVYQLVLFYQAITRKDVAKIERAIRAIRLFMGALPIFAALALYAETHINAYNMIGDQPLKFQIFVVGFGLAIVEGVLFVIYLFAAKKFRQSLRLESYSRGQQQKVTL